LIVVAVASAVVVARGAGGYGTLMDEPPSTSQVAIHPPILLGLSSFFFSFFLLVGRFRPGGWEDGRRKGKKSYQKSREADGTRHADG